MAQVSLSFLDVTVTVDSPAWLNKDPFIWMTSNTGEFGYASQYNTSHIKLARDVPVESVEVDGAVYTSTTSEATLAANEEYYLYDPETTELSIHFEDSKTPWAFDVIKIGQPLSLMKSKLSYKEFDGYFNNKLYLNHLTDIPAVTISRDNLFNGNQSYISSTISWQNEEGEYDLWASQSEVYGHKAVFSCWTGESIDDFDPDDIVVQWVGNVQRITTGRNVTIQVIDRRKQLDAPSPIYQVTWGNTGTSGEPIYIPEVWGEAQIITCECLTPEGPNSGYFEFMICQDTLAASSTVPTSQAPSAVYVAGASVSFTDATATVGGVGIRYVKIASSVFTSGSSYENLDAVTAFVEGYKYGSDLINTAPDILRAKIDQLYGKAYNSTNFDTDNWDDALDAAAPVSYFLNSTKGLNTVAQDLTRADLAQWEYGFDDKFRYFIFDENAEAVGTLYNWMFAQDNFSISITSDPAQALSQFNVGRNRRHDFDVDDPRAFVFDLYDDNFVAISRRTGVEKTISFLTPINGDAADTAAFGQKMYSVFGKEQETFSYPVAQEEAINWFPRDYINVETNSPGGKANRGTVRCELVSKSLNQNRDITTLKFRIA